MEELLMLALFLGTGIGIYFWIDGSFNFLGRNFRRR